MLLNEISLNDEELLMLQTLEFGSLSEPFCEDQQNLLIKLDNLGLAQFKHDASDGKPGYTISTNGEAYLAYRLARDDDLRKASSRRRFDVIMVWISVIATLLTLAISAATFLNTM